MSETADETQLARDADFTTPLKRVSYEAGMLLGLEATRDEQTYHRQRLNRQQYWLHGSGTLVGMVVAIEPLDTTETGPILTHINVSPGIGIDGLGREVSIQEGYCVDLGAWLQAQTEASLRDGYDEDNDLLWLRVTVRYQACEVAKQPVLARKLNLSTDAVQPSRTADSILLEMIPELPPEAEGESFHPWAVHNPVDQAFDINTLDPSEQAVIQAADGNPALQQQLLLNARLLHALDGEGVDTNMAAGQLEEGARLLLARVSIAVTDLHSILDSHVGDPVVNPNDIHVNNLVRPFLTTASQLAYLARTTL
jgi:hypothetical protein